MELQTTRLRLREIEEEDWLVFHALHSDREVIRYIPFDLPTERESQERVAEQIEDACTQPRRNYGFAVVDRTKEVVIGWCQLSWHYDNCLKGETELSYVLHRGYWGQGIATEVTQRLLQFGFEEMDTHRIFATCLPTNIASWRVLEKIGMKQEGHLRRHLWIRDGWHDSLLYGISDHTYRQRQHIHRARQDTMTCGHALKFTDDWEDGSRN